MNRLFKKKSKKLHKSARQHIYLGIPTHIAAGPLGFQAELDIGPKGESRSYRDLENQPDPTVTPDENDTRASRIVFQDKKEDQGLYPPGTSTAGAAVGGGEHGEDPTSECF